MTRNELIIKLAVANYDPNRGVCSWIENATTAADCLLSALDKSPPTQVADIPRCPRCGHALRTQLMGTLVCDSCGTTHAPHWPVKDGAAPATAAPGGESKERTCVWTARPGWSAPACQATRQLEWRESTAAAFKFCPHCGGKIIPEST